MHTKSGKNTWYVFLSSLGGGSEGWGRFRMPGRRDKMGGNKERRT